MVSMFFRWRQVLEWIWSGFLWWCWPSWRGASRSSTWASFPPGRWCLTSRAACSCVWSRTLHIHWRRHIYVIKALFFLYPWSKSKRTSVGGCRTAHCDWMNGAIGGKHSIYQSIRCRWTSPQVYTECNTSLCFIFWCLTNVAIHLLERFVHQMKSLLKSCRVSNMLLPNVT